MARHFGVLAAALVLIFAVVPGTLTFAAEPSYRGMDSGSDDDAYAEYHGVSRATALREIADLPLVAGLEAQIEAQLPKQFAGVWISHDPTYRVVVALVDGKVGTAESMAREMGLASPVEQIEASHSYAELVSLADDLRTRRLEPDYTVKVDLRSNRVVVRVLDFDAFVERLDGKAASASNVIIERVPRLGGPSIYAGLSTLTCTFGFTVRKNGTTTEGITTAAHCPDTQSYAGTNLPLVNASNGSADTQWHTTPGMTDEARMKTSASGTTRNVTSRTMYSNVVIGQTICKYGYTTGYGCGEVEEKEADAPWVPNQTGRYISLKRCGTDLSTEGDSGGPVFYNNSAFGIISGWQFGGLACQDELVFASVSYMEGNLGLTIKTQ